MQRFAFALVLAMSGAGTPIAGEADKAPAPEDRYLWLEDVDGRQGARLGAGAQRRERQGARDRTSSPRSRSALLDDPRLQGPHPVRRRSSAPWYYNFWRDAKNPRGLWRRTTLDEYRKPEPAWETVLDLDALGGGREGELGLARAPTA